MTGSVMHEPIITHLMSYLKKMFAKNYDEWNIVEHRHEAKIVYMGWSGWISQVSSEGRSSGVSFYRAVLAIEGCSALLGW